MSTAPEQSFDGAAAIFNEHAKTLRGYVRYQVIESNLEPYLSQTPMQVLDIGGGSGIDAAWLAVRGHSVTLLEASKVQCDAAQARFNFFLTQPERDRITIVQGRYSKLPKSTPAFDLVMMHGVAMYQLKPDEFIKKAGGHLKVGGIFSLVEKGYYGAQARAIRRGDEEQLHMLQQSKVFINSMKLNAHAFRPEQLEAYLYNAGVIAETWSGVRVITDEMFENVADIDQETLSEIVVAEYRQGKHPGIRAQGQMLHFIGRKQS